MAGPKCALYTVAKVNAGSTVQIIVHQIYTYKYLMTEVTVFLISSNVHFSPVQTVSDLTTAETLVLPSIYKINTGYIGSLIEC